MNLESEGQQAAEKFAQHFGRPPKWLVAAPGRVNLIGEHTDYNEGYVLPMAIERYTIIAAAPSLAGANRARIYSVHGQDTCDINLAQPIKPFASGNWANYTAGVIAGFQARGLKPGGFDALIHSTVPVGGGLSSSAALEVATATLLESMTGQRLDPAEKALLCQRAEHGFARVPCGIMDQFISVMGKADHLLLLDCRSQKTELIPMRDASIQILITNTNVEHSLGSGEYAKRRRQCEAAAKILGVPALRDTTLPALEAARTQMDEVLFRRARHAISEIERTRRAAEEIRAAQWQVVGELMYESHRSLRDDYEVSCEELNVVVGIAQSIGSAGGMIGCRMTGGGFGGCTVALVKAEFAAQIQEKIAAEYERETGRKASQFVSRPALGATVLRG